MIFSISFRWHVHTPTPGAQIGTLACFGKSVAHDFLEDPSHHWVVTHHPWKDCHLVKQAHQQKKPGSQPDPSPMLPLFKKGEAGDGSEEFILLEKNPSQATCRPHSSHSKCPAKGISPHRTVSTTLPAASLWKTVFKGEK